MSCPVIKTIVESTIKSMEVDELALLLSEVDALTLQQALVQSNVVGVDPEHLRMALNYEVIKASTVLEVALECDPDVVHEWVSKFIPSIGESEAREWIRDNYDDDEIGGLMNDERRWVIEWIENNT